MTIDPALAGEDYCYLTTRGRVSGRPHTIEIWFAIAGATLYMLSGGGTASDWVKNIRRTPAVSLRIGERYFTGPARLVAPSTDEDAQARRLLLAKYRPHYSGDLAQWGRTAQPVAVDLPVALAARRGRAQR